MELHNTIPGLNVTIFELGPFCNVCCLQLSVITASSFMWSFASHVTTGESILPNFDTLDWPSLYQTIISLPFGSMLYTGLFSTAFCLCAEVGYLAYSCSLPLTDGVLP